MNQIIEVKQSGWIWIINRSVKKPLITGKYLFFSKDKNLLIELSKRILLEYGLSVAKVPLSDEPVGEDFVLCVYDAEPKLKDELKKYANQDIRYRYWKSDEDTLKGKYSNQFKQAIEKKNET